MAIAATRAAHRDICLYFMLWTYNQLYLQPEKCIDITVYIHEYHPHRAIWRPDMAAICLDCKSHRRGQRGLTGVTPLWPHPSSEPQSLDINCALCQLGNWIQIGSLCSGWYVRNYTMKGIPYPVHCYGEHPFFWFTHQPQTAPQRYVPVQNQFHELEREEGIVST